MLDKSYKILLEVTPSAYIHTLMFLSCSYKVHEKASSLARNCSSACRWASLFAR